MEVSGLRSSWVTTVTNSVFSWLASWTFWFNSSSSCRSFRSCVQSRAVSQGQGQAQVSLGELAPGVGNASAKHSQDPAFDHDRYDDQRVDVEPALLPYAAILLSVFDQVGATIRCCQPHHAWRQPDHACRIADPDGELP